MRQDKNRKFITVALILIGGIALHNQRLSITDPENTYPKKIRRAVRVWLNPPENELERNLIGKGIQCDSRARLYRATASATVVIKSAGSLGAGVFVGPRLIVTAAHVVDGHGLRVYLPAVKNDDLAEPGDPIDVAGVQRIRGLDLAFVSTKDSYPSWLELEKDYDGDNELMIIGHPKGKYYSLQKARIKKKDMLNSSEFIIFKDNEIFFGNSGGAIVGCNGKLAGVVSSMSNYQNSMLKQGMGINSKTIAAYMNRLRRG
ncbi:MAG: serine protease [Nitrospinales bacterium]